MAKEKSPAFQFYPNEFMNSEVAAMTLEERGAYITLLCYCWRELSVPNDVKRIAALVGVTPRKARALWDVLGPRFLPPDAQGRCRHRRLDTERQKQQAHRDAKSDAGKAGAAKRWQSHDAAIPSATGKPMAEGMANGMAEGMANGMAEGMAKNSSSVSDLRSAPAGSQSGTSTLTSNTEQGESHIPALWAEKWRQRWPDGIGRHKHTDLETLKHCAKQLGVSECAERIDRYLACSDSVLLQRKHPLVTFVNQIDSYGPPEKSPRLSAMERATKAFLEGT